MPDLRVKYISENHNVWAAHAGRNKRQYTTFLEEGVVFLETPGFPGVGIDFSNINDVRKGLRLSDNVLQWVLGNVPNPPSRVLDFYEGNPIEIHEEGARSFNAQVGNVVSLFHEAKRGDLLLVPGRGQYKSVLIGEFETDYSPDDLISLPQYENELTPFRKINWIDVETPKRSFANYVSKRLENRHAVINLSKRWTSNKSIAEEIYKKAYDNFIWGDEAHITLLGPRYNSKDPQGIFDATELIKAVYAIFLVSERDDGSDLTDQNLAQISANFYNGEAVVDFSLNFNSPGEIGFGAASLGAIAVLGVIFLASSGFTYEQAFEGLQIAFNDERAPAVIQDECNNQMRGILNSIDQGKFDEIQRKCNEARNSIGLDIDRQPGEDH